MRNRLNSVKSGRIMFSQFGSPVRDQAMERPFSSLVYPLVQIPQNPRRHAPNIALAERNRVVAPHHALPVAAMEGMVLHIHQEGEWHLEGIVDFAAIEGR